MTSRAMKSRNPRTALTGVPSGAVSSGTPKNARKYSDAESRQHQQLLGDAIRSSRATPWSSGSVAAVTAGAGRQSVQKGLRQPTGRLSTATDVASAP